MKTRSARFGMAAALVAAAIAGPACQSSSDEVQRPGDSNVLPGPDFVEVDAFDGPTTDGTIALSNLNGQIESHRKLVARFDENPDFMATLVELLLTRTQFAGSYADFDEVLELSERVLLLKPEAGASHSLRASVLGAVHRFDEAWAALDAAEKHGFDVAAQRETIDLARGDRLEAARDARLARVKASPSYDNLVALAGAEAALGNFDTADARFREALDAYEDVSPLPVAWVAFQRGVMWAEQAGRSDLAKPLYEEAVRRLPGYIVANVHLSELEVASGQLDLALTRLERVRTTTLDPEPTGYLAELLLETTPGVAKAHAASATQTYDQLLSRHPRAFADHGSEFFSGAAGNDPERGLALALDNLKHRKNDRAFTVAIEAALAADQPALACQIAKDAGDQRPNIPLQDARKRAWHSGC